jgi:hypothetical protein
MKGREGMHLHGRVWRGKTMVSLKSILGSYVGGCSCNNCNILHENLHTITSCHIIQHLSLMYKQIRKLRSI